VSEHSIARWEDWASACPWPERPEFAAVRMVALTGYGQSENVRLSWEAGFDDHLTKPVDFAALDRVLAGLPTESPPRL